MRPCSVKVSQTVFPLLLLNRLASLRELSSDQPPVPLNPLHLSSRRFPLLLKGSRVLTLRTPPSNRGHQCFLSPLKIKPLQNQPLNLLLNMPAKTKRAKSFLPFRSAATAANNATPKGLIPYSHTRPVKNPATNNNKYRLSKHIFCFLSFKIRAPLSFSKHSQYKESIQRKMSKSEGHFQEIFDKKRPPPKQWSSFLFCLKHNFIIIYQESLQVLDQDDPL